MKVTCIIVDDEELARKGMRSLLSDYPEIEILDSYSNGLEAIEGIGMLKPDLVFLDVQMPGVNGFEVVASLSVPRPQIIFVTAHDQFAIDAFEVNAVDYLLKPFTDERFDLALKKAVERISLQKRQDLENLVIQTSKGDSVQSKLITGLGNEETVVFKSDGQVYKLSVGEIVFVEAFDYYIKVHISERFFLIRESMKKMEQRLPDFFLRIHKSYLVNTRMVKQYGKSEDGANYQVILRTGMALKVSRSYKNTLLERLG